ncbi:major facilitator superfamily transporter [Pseudomassariella vexata]|uniref:Major facilitator superfamily transporter n=1 Tax=Pseudomassariella vexata TaxID=1141098 RepID=A0A1Y2EK37_9PEZI|nr:major facilitator superfamily transporter [Pseudomassariella vexata]ORY71908.1 major facilitator superfamily transporter [Pseudomassariella vexata]
MAGGNEALVPSDPRNNTQPLAQSRYTVWTPQERRLFVCVLGYLALASSLSANIYFPLIDVLVERYAVSTQAINLTITLFIVFQGVTPSFWSPLSDTWGRRPVYLCTFTVFTLASLGLSIVDRNYPALLLLRALQSVGSSAVVSLAYASVADVVAPSERGAYLAPMLMTVNLGPCIGPVVGGGIVVATGDPRWCFRALLIFGSSATLMIGWIMSETKRSIVGNGAVPARGIWRTWWTLLCHPSQPAAVAPHCLVRRRISRALAFRAPPALWFCVQTSLAPIFGLQYGFNPFEVGLCFLAGGAGVIAAGFVSGKLMDWNYKHVAREAGLPIDHVHGDDVERFPIEQARTRGSIVIILVSLCIVIGYGWVIEVRTHPAVPLVFQACIGCKSATLHQIYGALIVDIFPGRTATAAASKNIMRCTLAGILVAVLDPLVGALGYGWVFTLLGIFDAATCILAVLALNRWGRTWRNRRKVNQDE